MLYLFDAMLTETNHVRLLFLDEDLKKTEFNDEEYRPYFMATHPLTSEQMNVVNLFSGDVQKVEKKDLFSDEKRLFSKIYWPNPKVAQKAAEKFDRCWESEIDFCRSCVYDRGMIFGTQHSESDFKPVLDVSVTERQQFDRIFGEFEASDSLKHELLLYWYALLRQPVPTLNANALGINEGNIEDVHSAWLLSRIANIPLARAFASKRVSEWWKSIIYTYLRKSNTLIPTADELTLGHSAHTVAGALTVAPKAGVYFDTTVVDFESLYPSCVDSFNLSYETVNCPHKQCEENRISDFDGYVCTNRRGFYSVLVGALKELRIKMLKPASKDVSLNQEERNFASAAARLLKLMLVSSYGVTVRIHGLACPPLAEAMTGYGRYALKEAWRLAEDHGMHPLYGDTDSLFLDKCSAEQVAWLNRAVKEKFGLDLALDKHYRLCALPKAKKAYFGILDDGTPDIKGVTAIKSNSPKFINDIFKKCASQLASVRRIEEFERAKSQIRLVVQSAIVDLKNGRVNLEDLVYSVRLFFNPNEKSSEMQTAHQPYQCALQLIDSGKQVKEKDAVSFYKVKPFRYRNKTFTVKPVQFKVNPSQLNIDDYVRNLLTALNQTFEPMGIKLEKEEAKISKWL